MVRVTHIFHSGFVVELPERVLIFDWYTGELPDFDRGKRVDVFVSHAHADHYGPCIWTLRESCPHLQYILDEGTPVPEREERRGGILRVRPCQELEVDGLQIRTLLSTDQGVAFLVRTGQETLFHAGDLNIWDWYDEPEEDNRRSERICREEYARLCGEHIDLAFLPLDPRLRERAVEGPAAFLELVGADVIFPMHYGRDQAAAERYLRDPLLAGEAGRFCFADSWER